jgi:hypothetical protein
MSDDMPGFPIEHPHDLPPDESSYPDETDYVPGFIP